MAQTKNNRTDRFTWGAGDIEWTKKPQQKKAATKKQTKKGKK